MDENITNVSPDTQVEEQATETKTYTEAEVQSLVDQRVTQALQKQQRKTEAKVREAEKLAKMNESEKYEYQLQQREAAILAKEKELALLENKNTASKILADKGLSLALVDFIVAEDAETMDSNIKILEQAFKQSVKAEVEKRMAGSTPKKAVTVNKTITKEDFAKMPYSEMIMLKQQDPELYRQLSAQ